MSGAHDCHTMSGLQMESIYELCFCVIATVPNLPGFAAQVPIWVMPCGLAKSV